MREGAFPLDFRYALLTKKLSERMPKDAGKVELRDWVDFLRGSKLRDKETTDLITTEIEIELREAQDARDQLKRREFELGQAIGRAAKAKDVDAIKRARLDRDEIRKDIENCDVRIQKLVVEDLEDQRVRAKLVLDELSEAKIPAAEKYHEAQAALQKAYIDHQTLEAKHLINESIYRDLFLEGSEQRKVLDEMIARLVEGA